MTHKNVRCLLILSSLIGVLCSAGPPPPRQVPFSNQLGKYVPNPPRESAISKAQREKTYREFQQKLVDQALEAAQEKKKDS